LIAPYLENSFSGIHCYNARNSPVSDLNSSISERSSPVSPVSDHHINQVNNTNTSPIPPTSLPSPSLPPTSLPPTLLPPTSLPPTSLPPMSLPPAAEYREVSRMDTGDSTGFFYTAGASSNSMESQRTESLNNIMLTMKDSRASDFPIDENDME